MNDTPYSLLGINALPCQEREWIYRRLLPKGFLLRFDINLRTLENAQGERVVSFATPAEQGTVEIEVRRASQDEDPALYLQLADTLNMQIELLLVVINDPDGPRFDTDRLPNGERTHFGTVARNLEAECRAMRYGLAPGQVRPGLHFGGQVMQCIDDFMGGLGHALWLLQPLAYHNAILFERWGFNYMNGHAQMEQIDREFQPGGTLHARLDNSTPFRPPGAWQTVRGRSWAIQDGILGEPFTGIHMYKQVGKKADESTFPGAVW